MKKVNTYFYNFLFISYFLVVTCLYEDQAGKFDWRQQYIGKVKFTYIDPVIAGSQRFIVATEDNVIACLSTRTGSIIWRQILESGKDGEIDVMTHEGELIILSGKGQFIRGWDPNTGVLQWETSFPNTPNSGSQIFFDINTLSKEIIRVQMSHSEPARVAVYSFTRASLKTSEPISTSWFTDDTKCNFVSSHFFVCIENSKKSLYLLSIKDSGTFIPIPFHTLGIDIKDNIKNVNALPLPYQGSSEKPYLAIQLDNGGLLLQIHPPGIKLLHVIPNFNKITSTLIEDTLVSFTLSQQDHSFQIKALEFSTKTELSNFDGSFVVNEDRGDLETFFVLPYTKKDHGISYKVLCLFSDYSMLLIHQQGRILWSREEALTNIIAAEIMDLPLSDRDANIEQEFDQPDAGIFTMFFTRIKSQVYLLQSFILQVLLGNHGKQNGEQQTLARDTFGLHKMIVVVTAAGKSFGIDNLSGVVVWSHLEKNLSPFHGNHLLLFIQRSTAHWPFPPVCTAFGQHGTTGKTHLYSFDPITGVTIDSRLLPYKIIQVMPSATLTSYLRPILLLDSNLEVHIYPESHDISRNKNTHFMFSVATGTGILRGYSLLDEKESQNTLKAIEVWRANLPYTVTQVVTKNPLEKVHSQGRVMGDRSVLYKYLNPNLAAVFTEGNDAIQKSFCNVYLIDVITGLTVYTATHKRCKSPIHVVHSENWIVYSFYNDKSRRVEISSIELFEGMQQSNTTTFSSFTPPPLPLVEHQTFIFPSNILAMTDTVTERGITNKHLLIVLPTGGILELPKTFLDPRRPITPLPEHREEGLIPYIPELPIVADNIINYNQSVQRVKGIVRAPSALESTCLVFVHGLDLFYTRVTPSSTFDILKDDFDHFLIGGVLVALLILSYTTKRLAQRNTLRTAWK